MRLGYRGSRYAKVVHFYSSVQAGSVYVFETTLRLVTKQIRPVPEALATTLQTVHPVFPEARFTH